MSDDKPNSDIAETYLRHCSPDIAYKWLSEHMPAASSKGVETVLLERDTSNR